MSWLPNWLTGYDEENAIRAQQADAQLQAMNQQTYGTPYVGNDYGTYGPAAQEAQIQEAFDTELQSQANSIIGGPLRGLGTVVASILKAIPLWVWLAGAVVLFAWLGGFSWLAALARGSLKAGAR